jgi:cytochrome c oxidase subunit II
MSAPDWSFIPLWPPAISAHASAVDLMALGFTGVVLLFSAPVFVLLVYFSIKYRRGSKANRLHRPKGNVWLESSWMVIPFLPVLGFFIWSAWMYVDLASPPDGALEIDVVAKQWMWKFQHPGGQREIDMLHVPIGQPVKLKMISQDVIHSLYLPALRIKQDVLPDRYTSLWFRADRTGTFRLHCAEFCGTDHSLMGGAIVVMTPSDYAAWLRQSETDQTIAAAGEELYRRYGCSGCHGASATVHAPPLAGLYGRPVPLSDGSVVIADDRYIRDSILLPQRQTAAGYPRIMPSFQNLLGEEDLLKIIAYIKSLDTQPGAPP